MPFILCQIDFMPVFSREHNLFLILCRFPVVRSCSGFFQVRVRRRKSARGQDDVIDLDKKLRSGLGFGCCFFSSSVEDLRLSGYRRVFGRYTCVLHDVETSSLHILRSTRQLKRS